MVDKRLFDTARCIILYLDSNGGIVNFNPYMEEITGYRIADVRGRNWFDVFIPENEKSRIKGVFGKTKTGDNTDGTVNSINTADGGKRTVIWSNTRITDSNGTLTGLLCCGQDITEKEYARNRLLIRTQQLVSLSEIAYETLQETQFQKLVEFILRYIINTLGTARAVYLEISEEGDQLQAYAGSGASHITFHEVTIPLVQGTLISHVIEKNHSVAISKFLDDDRFRKITEIDEQKYNSVLAVPAGSGDETLGVLSIYHDTEHEFSTEEINYLQSVANIICMAVERNRTQSTAILLSQELAKQSRFNLIGELGAHIAHEINQPLTALMNYIQSCRRLINSTNKAEPETIEILMKKAQDEAERASSIIRHIRDYLETGQLDKTREDLNKVIEETCRIISPELAEKKITLELDLATETPLMTIDKLQIQQVLLNVLHNSIKAMDTVVNKRVVISSYPNGEFVEITIQDSGIGIPPDIPDKGFTSRKDTNKTGLGFGLSICKSIIEGHDGKYWFSRAGKGGTIFHFTLPVGDL